MNRLERATEGAARYFACPECGEVFGGRGDVPLALCVRDWLAGTGQTPTPDPVLDRIVAHEHEALREVVLRDIPGLAAALDARGPSSS